MVATARRLIDSLGEAVRKMSNTGSSLPVWKKYDVVVSFNSENGKKIVKLAIGFDIPTTTLTKIKKKDKTVFDYEAGRSSETFAAILIKEHF